MLQQQQQQQQQQSQPSHCHHGPAAVLKLWHRKEHRSGAPCGGVRYRTNMYGLLVLLEIMKQSEIKSNRIRIEYIEI